MDKTLFSIPAFLRYIPLFGMTVLLHAAEPSVTFSQTVFYPENAELRVTARSNLLDGFILLENGERLSGFSSDIESFGLTGKPLPGLRLYGGSLLASGFVSRARSPVFALYTPFYTPVSAHHGPVLKNSETGDILNTAAELTIRNTRIASLINMTRGSIEPSWILLSQTVPAFEANDPTLTVSVLAATRTRTASANAADSWFLTEIPLPETRIFMPGLEILVAKGNFSGSCAGFLDTGRFVAPAGAIRAEGAVNLPGFSLAGGMYRSDSNFEDLDGTRNSSITRIFAAPSILVSLGTESASELKWGGMIVGDTVRREKYFTGETAAVSGGTGLELNTSQSRSEIRIMKKGDETELAGGVFLGKFVHPSLKLELRAKTVQTRLTGDIKKESSISVKLSVAPARWFFGSLSGTAGQTTAHDGMDYSVSASCGFTIKKTRQDWNSGIKITFQNAGEPPAGCLSLKLVLH